jgi:hypothetical protein
VTSLASVFVDARLNTKAFGPDIRAGMHSSSVVKESETAGKTHGSKFASAFGGAIRGIAAPLAGVFAVAGAGTFLKGAIEEAREAQKVSAQTAAVIKSTGGVAKVTTKQIGDLANAISAKTGIDDEAIQSGSNLLLTFKNIHNETGKGNSIFSRATQTITDLSVGMGQSLKSSAVQVGKALNDPIKGITALSRVGVTFTEGQKKQITQLVKSGDTMKAQKIILRELGTEFGGSAAAQATAGEKAKVAFDNLKESVGTALLPVLDKLQTIFVEDIVPALYDFAGFVQSRVIPAIKDVVGWFQSGTDGTSKLSEGFEVLKAGVVTFVQAALPVVKSVVDYFVSMWPQIKPTLDAIMNGFESLGKFLVAFFKVDLAVLTFIWKHFGETITNYAKGTFANIVQVVKGVFTVLGGIFDFFTALFTGDWSGMWDAMKQIASGVKDILGGIVGQLWNSIMAGLSVAVELIELAWSGLWSAVTDVATRAWDGLVFIVRNGVADIVDLFLGMAEKILDAADFAFGWIPGLGGKLDDAKRAFAGFRDDVNAYLRGIDDRHVTVSGSFSVPSAAQVAKVSAQLGGFASGGLIQGAGTGTSDSILARLSHGEFVQKASTVAREGVGNMHMLNQGRATIIPKFADGGLVVDSVVNSSGARVTASIADRIAARMAALLGAGMTRALDGIVGDLRPPAGLGGGAFKGLTGNAGIDRGLAWMQTQVGKPYLWGGVGPSGYDCSGLMSVLTNVLRGASNPYFRLGATSSMPWAGFLPGPGNFSLGWTTNYGGSGIGHTAGTLGGVNVESAGGVGVRMGSSARGANDGGFTGMMHLAGFDFGGLARGPGWMPKGPAPERVLSNRQTIAFERALDRGFGADGPLEITGQLSIDESGKAFIRGLARQEVRQRAGWDKSRTRTT